ncbi:MAG: FG-GAP-like repeat-containing protein, partial [Planctomycetota bacterium]
RNWVVPGTRDFNGDGRSDILWHHKVTAKNSRWLMDGTTVLPGSGPVQSFGDADWAAVATSE